MFTSAYYDYKKSSKAFVDNNEMLKEDIKAIEKQKKYMIWVQEFSKKIVVAIFILYLIIITNALILVYKSFASGYITGLDTLISEINLTFREIIGGYIIKSAVENSFKIAGNYFIGICDGKLKILQAEMEKENSNSEDKKDINDLIDDLQDVEPFDGTNFVSLDTDI